MQPVDLEDDLRIYFADSQGDTSGSICLTRKVIHSRQSRFRAAAELPAAAGEVDCLTTSSKNIKALEHYFV